jgi:hypothetical protein
VRRAPCAETRRVKTLNAGDERENMQREEDREAHEGPADCAVAEHARRRGREREEQDDVERQVVGR